MGGRLIELNESSAADWQTGWLDGWMSGYLTTINHIVLSREWPGLSRFETCLNTLTLYQD